MNLAQLQLALANLHLCPPDWPRAALYWAFLQRNRDFLHDEMRQQLSPSAYAFVAPALAQTNLLQAQLQGYDRWAGAAVWAELEQEIHGKPQHSHWSYADYFDEMIFSDDASRFQQNLHDFFQRNPITLAALQASSCHFEQNLLLACQRITRDLTDITCLFNDKHPGMELLSLQEISASGADFHKGGQQVLLLRFSARSTHHSAPFDLRLVYKPGDLSADCLLLGNSAAVNCVKSPDTPQFMSASLLEIVNQLAAQHADLGVLPLPIYRILPQQVTHTPVTQTQFQACYGYLEYIASEEADFVIEQNQDGAAIIARFYREMGQWLALCSCFSLSDLHLQNWRVHQFRPYPIDLEVSLIKCVDDFADSELFGPYGGITGEVENISEWQWHINHRLLLMSQKFATTRYHNRLYQRQFDHSLRVVEVEQNALLRGFAAGMRLIARGQQAGAFDAWCARMQGVVVRYLPYPTHALEMIRRSVYLDCLHRPPPGNTLEVAVRVALQHSLTARYLAEYPHVAWPHFVLLQETYCAPDYLQFDIPAFYHCIGSLDLLDARGMVIVLPTQLQLASGETIQLTFDRQSFFADAPTKHNVWQQLQNLPPQLEVRLQHLRASIVEMLKG